MDSRNNSSTPMWQQYWEIKQSLPPQTMLLFRLGDFYEVFYEDAEIGSAILGITLTQRNGVAMAGIPHHAANAYIDKLLAAGRKIAICDQAEAARPGKLVKRCLTKILTPGTVIEGGSLQESHNHYIVAIDCHNDCIHAAWLEVSTGDFFIVNEPNAEIFLSLLNSLDPKELIFPENALNGTQTLWRAIGQRASENRIISSLPEVHFEIEEGNKVLKRLFNVLQLDGFGIVNDNLALGTAGALITYATETLRQTPQNIRNIREHKTQQHLVIDEATFRNLEIFRASSTQARKGSLIDVIDRTVTAAGARLIEKFLAAPLMDVNGITQRQNYVEAFVDNAPLINDIQALLKNTRDVHRTLSRLQNHTKNPRELGAIRDTLQNLPHICHCLEKDDKLHILATKIGTFENLSELLTLALEPTLPNNVDDGNFIRDGYDAELDHQRALKKESQTWLSDLETEEQRRTGIKNLKIRYNNTFGYYIEVTKSNLSMVPQNYIRKQTTTSSERYFTETLKNKEHEILHAEEKALSIELNLFKKLVAAVLQHAVQLAETADILSEIDVYAGWAKLAREWHYCRPNVNVGEVLEVEQGRHPVVEQMLKNEANSGSEAVFIANDTFLSTHTEQILILTGPNMAGKSTYIRQIALITLLAQIGCFVPAKSCTLGVVDKIFSRIGASDALARGQSTFMVEMYETANILNNATRRSLVILDEVGRGTSTYDGLSIAWAVIEHLHAGNSGPRTLFATHYHELTKLEQTLARVRNYSVAVKEWGHKIIFVRQVVRGQANKSYGIQVARLAGVPESVITRAQQILEELEKPKTNKKLPELGEQRQMMLF